jgi:hypothetical protein
MKTIKLVCKQCGKTFLKSLSIYKNDLKKVNAGKFCSRECYHKSPESRPATRMKREKSKWWKGGRIFERGYKLVLVDKEHPYGIAKGGGEKYIREHRLIMEKHLGRYLKKNEVVHHIDGDRKNNELKNLKLMTTSEHARDHILNYWKKRKELVSNAQFDF